MEWKEALYIKNREGKINDKIYDALLKLPDIRNEVFFPDYQKYGYIGYEPVYGEFETTRGINSSLRIPLSSIQANRTLLLSYIFMNNAYELGSISNGISISDATEGWGTTIYFRLLAGKRGFIELKKDYNIPEIYLGNPEQKLEACLKQIKYNYDTIAPDIISGENWDSHAWNVGGYF